MGELDPRVPRRSLGALPGALPAALALALARSRHALVVVVASGPSELERHHADLQLLSDDAQLEPWFFPALENRTPGKGREDPDLLGCRQDALQRLRAWHPGTPAVLATSAQALLQPTIPAEGPQSFTQHLRIGDEIELTDCVAALVAAGYDHEPEVVRKGALAVRGGILDVWPLTIPDPLRIEFFGPEVVSIRLFDPAEQRSLRRIEQALIPPAALPPEGGQTLTERLPARSILLWLDHETVEAHAEHFAESDDDALTWPDVRDQVDAADVAVELFEGDPAPPGAAALELTAVALPGLADIGRDMHTPDALVGMRARLLRELERRAHEGARVLVYLDTEGARDHIARDIDTPSLELRTGALSGGFELPAARLIIATQSDLYGRRRQTTRRYVPATIASRDRTAAAAGSRVDSLEHLEEGDLVVHVEHGVGRYLGLTEIEFAGRRHEVLSIEYAEGAKLHVPVSHAHLLSRYVGVGREHARLHSLGSARWRREKADAQRAIADLAASLLETQAHRETQQGFAFSVDTPWLHDFETAFPYTETLDQTRVIADIKADLQSQRPMDRLVCGDAGYGKTEVAMRAAFIAVMQGRQVAVLVPTTVLAQQHFDTFRERMAAYPVRVEMLSRFCTGTSKQRTLAALTEGTVDIVIGTHALIQPGIVFKDLGLVIVDEEQRFGVAHKERLKQVRRLVDVLTLTATPIPRTLYMSLTGARDMSLLQTPPQERVAIETRVVRDSDAILRQAILQELNRDGQIYVLYNRVLTIDRMFARLEALVPEARIVVAHGQMPARQLERVVKAFSDGLHDVLLCTTIIESGVDNPRANTILIHRADRFGIADLYQLRGRVGRSSHKAYAYLLLPPHGQVDADARQRIGALRKYSGLSAGLPLAMKDLEIRGAGNLLGASQSGHITHVGFGLYCQLLRRTVARMKGEEVPPLIDTDLKLDFIDLSPAAHNDMTAACLPYAYIEEDAQRIAIYRQIAEATEESDLQKVARLLEDRFGRPPPAVKRLLRLSRLRIMAAERNITRIENRNAKILLYRDGEPITHAGRLPTLGGRTSDEKLSALMNVVKAQ